jgi:predicted enzyme related to lactoylglutathione lyase
MARPYHSELGATDPARAAAFYKRVFGLMGEVHSLDHAGMGEKSGV